MKALSIFSGGLDSMLASSIIRNIGIEVLAIFFETPFFASQRARQSAHNINLPIKVINITERHLEVVKNPRHGHGENMNPCIDCHTLMFRVAGEMMEEEDAGFLISGEVLGQRPLSQNKQALSIVENESGFKGFILRPLSARLLPVTIPEQNGWVKRNSLLDLSGRSRKPQMALARDLGITDYPSPAGGCLLTDRIFSRRLKDLFSFNPGFKIDEIELLKLGRHFRLTPATKMIVGRNKVENMEISRLAQDEDLILHTVSVPGPTVLVSGKKSSEIEKSAAELTASYSDGEGKQIEIEIIHNSKEKRIQMRGKEKSEFKKYMI
jgi:tRNA-specific 2-thiouridylase